MNFPKHATSHGGVVRAKTLLLPVGRGLGAGGGGRTPSKRVIFWPTAPRLRGRGTELCTQGLPGSRPTVRPKVTFEAPVSSGTEWDWVVLTHWRRAVGSCRVFRVCPGGGGGRGLSTLLVPGDGGSGCFWHMRVGQPSGCSQVLLLPPGVPPTPAQAMLHTKPFPKP